MTLTTDSAGEASIAGDAEANLNAGSGAQLNLVNYAESSGAISGIGALTRRWCEGLSAHASGYCAGTKGCASRGLRLRAFWRRRALHRGAK